MSSAAGHRDATPAERLRAFVALEVSEALHQRLDATMAELRPRLSGVRWVAASGIHLTLRFLGWTTHEVLRSLEPPLRAAAALCPAGVARAGSLGMFPERGSPRVLWVGLELPAPVIALQAACEAAAVGAGFERETRPFRSHLTLGRWRERAKRPALEPVDLGDTPLERLVLFRSELMPQGAVYTPLAVFPLGPA